MNPVRNKLSDYSTKKSKGPVKKSKISNGVKKVVLAYSGGLDTSIAVSWLKEKGHQVIAYVADVGQDIDKAKLKKKAKQAGASKVIIEDLKKEFVKDYIMPALKANAVYEGKYYLATALSRPLIAEKMVKIAKKENAKYVAHGCTGKGNDQVRFELTFNILAPELKVIAPVRVWSFKSREEQIDYCKKNHIPVEATKKSPYSIDKNLWGASIECGVLEDIKKAPPEDAYMLTRSPQNAPEKAQKIEIYFKKGVPVKINGKKTSSVELINKLNKLAGKHAIGRSDLVEDRVVGIKSREIYEAPAATILTFAHKELEGLVLDKKTLDFKKLAELTYSQVIYSGFYFSPLKKALDVFIDETQKPATGTIKLKLYKGNIATVSRQSENSLYSKKLATYKKEDIFDQSLAEGFIKILALPYKRIKDSH